jgi:hypothetical protein
MNVGRFLLLGIIFLTCIDPVMGEDKPRWLIGIFADYAATSEYVPSAGRIIDSFRTIADAGTPGLGISATRMITDRFGIGGEIMGQSYKWKSHTYGIDIGDIYWPKPGAAADYAEGPSGTDFRLNYLFRTMWIIRPSAATHLTFLLGAGAYSYSRGELGFHGGIMIRHALSDKTAIVFGSRVHLIPVSSELGALVQLVAGIEFRVEPKQQ